jgi:hypothetical protein
MPLAFVPHGVKIEGSSGWSLELDSISQRVSD